MLWTYPSRIVTAPNRTGVLEDVPTILKLNFLIGDLEKRMRYSDHIEIV